VLPQGLHDVAGIIHPIGALWRIGRNAGGYGFRLGPNNLRRAKPRGPRSLG